MSPGTRHTVRSRCWTLHFGQLLSLPRTCRPIETKMHSWLGSDSSAPMSSMSYQLSPQQTVWVSLGKSFRVFTGGWRRCPLWKIGGVGDRWWTTLCSSCLATACMHMWISCRTMRLRFRSACRQGPGRDEPLSCLWSMRLPLRQSHTLLLSPCDRQLRLWMCDSTNLAGSRRLSNSMENLL